METIYSNPMFNEFSFWLCVISNSVQFSCSVMSDSVTPWAAARQASLSITNSWSLLKLMSTELVMPSNHLISVISFSTRLQSFPTSGSFLKSQHFIWGDQSIGVSASASVFPMNIEGWFPLGLTGLKCLLQHHNLKASILWCSAFFMVQFLPPALHQQCQDTHRGQRRQPEVQESSGAQPGSLAGGPSASLCGRGPSF